MTIIDLRMEYKKATGDPYVPITHDHYNDVNYILWLEEQLLEMKKLHKKFIPFEPIKQ